MITFNIEDLRETARLQVLSGKKDFYDVTIKDFKETKRQVIYNCKHQCRPCAIKLNNKIKLIIFA